MPEEKQQQRDMTRIRVDPDGIKLGWNIIALLSALGLGLYISSIVLPINRSVRDLEMMANTYIQENNKRQVAAHEKLNDRIDTLNERVREVEINESAHQQALKSFQHLLEEGCK